MWEKMGRKSRAGQDEDGEGETIPRSAKKAGGVSESGKKSKRSESPAKATPSKGREAVGVSSGKTPSKAARPSKSESKKRGKGGDDQQQPSTPGGAAGSSGEETKSKKRKSSTGAVDAAEGEQREPTKVHMARFLSIQPSGISAMSHDPIGQRLAVARSNGDIQIWNTSLPRWHPVGVCGGSTLSQVGGKSHPILSSSKQAHANEVHSAQQHRHSPSVVTCSPILPSSHRPILSSSHPPSLPLSPSLLLSLSFSFQPSTYLSRCVRVCFLHVHAF